MTKLITLKNLPKTLTPNEDVLTLSINLNKLKYQQDERLHLKSALTEIKKYSMEHPELNYKELERQVDNLIDQNLPYQGITLFIQGNTLELFVLPRTTVDEVKLTISKSPDLLSILREQPNKMYYLLALEGTSFRLFKIVDKAVAPVKLDVDAPTDLVETLGSEKRGGELNFSGQGGSTTFHGHNETSKEKQIDLERYYREINKYLVETIDLTVPIVLMGLPKNLALFKRISEKLSLSEIQISKSPTDLTNAQIEKTTSNEISEQEVETITDDVAAINNKRVLTDTAEIDQAIDTNQLNKLIVNVGNLSNSVDDHLYNDINRIISRALKINSQVVVLKQEEPQSPALLEATTY
ncbi:hypothetical protein PL11_000250 [Lentilactobacillus curieae]|uniref:Bacterial archaeo-eukaryotic release factor family 6 domain-containing protein n=1 Tax=Lentilactobacillus curieae TaxID=1138822 RepID=A0A1S6QFV6_9LACO|nr:hypothetical protein [Lentilactobacillus curieae]AQW20489.1 hypothetical protein PL11_000250 [Lentilactobacillus curieae]